MKIHVVFTAPFRLVLNRSRMSVELEEKEANVRSLMTYLSKTCEGKIDSFLFEKGEDRILSGLMVMVNDRVFTGTEINQRFFQLRDDDEVRLLYFVSGG